MKSVRWFVGVSLIFFGKLAVWGGQTLFHLGLAVMGRKTANGRQRVSQSRLRVLRSYGLVPYTVETKDGRHITLYGTRK